MSYRGSLFFRNVLASLTHNHPLVYMRGVRHQDLSNIIDFIYHGEAEVRKEDLETFLCIARELGVEGMTKQVKKPHPESMSEGEMDEEKFKAIATEEKDGEAKKDFDCDQCGKTYGTWASLRTHIYNHSKDRDATAVVKNRNRKLHQVHKLTSHPKPQERLVSIQLSIQSQCAW